MKKRVLRFIPLKSLSVFMPLLFFPASPSLGESPLPQGFDAVSWGMSVSKVQGKTGAVRADPSSGFGYAEHGEEDPEVYTRTGPHGERVEYYFFKEELYKIFVVYDRILFHTRFYEELAEEIGRDFGPPQKTFEEKFFGLDIFYTRWEDDASILDLRKGAGFIYQVRIDKGRDSDKKRVLARRKSI